MFEEFERTTFRGQQTVDFQLLANGGGVENKL